MSVLITSFCVLLAALLSIYPTIVGSDNVSNTTRPSRGSSRNIYASHPLFVNPTYRRLVRRTMRTTTGRDRRTLRRFQNVPTAVWLSGNAALSHGRNNVARNALNAAKNQGRQSRGGNTPLVTFVLYNLPNRDCAAAASANDVCCYHTAYGTCDMYRQDGGCSSGVEQYARRYIDRLAALVRRNCAAVPMSFIVEPDALPQIVTNTANPACGSSTQAGYREGITYAVTTLAVACRRAAIFVDAGNPSWLGWKDLTDRYVSLVSSLGITSLIRGFSINVSSYGATGIPCPSLGMCSPNRDARHRCCRHDACGLRADWNVGFNCATFAQSLVESARRASPSFSPHVVIDTSRNGAAGERSYCHGQWCNIQGAGVGVWPTADTVDTRVVDAYMWIKLPGESDGCTSVTPNGLTCGSFAHQCASHHSISRAPVAGAWFPEAVKSLMRNGVAAPTM